MTATLTRDRTDVIRLPTQKKRAAFVRREIRAQGFTIQAIADETGHCWRTIHNFAHEYTMNPRTDTTINIFRALGYDVVFARAKESKGAVSL